MEILKTKQVELRNIRSLADFNLVIENGESIVLHGPSGAGKSTVLEVITFFVDDAAKLNFPLRFGEEDGSADVLFQMADGTEAHGKLSLTRKGGKERYKVEVVIPGQPSIKGGDVKKYFAGASFFNAKDFADNMKSAPGRKKNLELLASLSGSELAFESANEAIKALTKKRAGIVSAAAELKAQVGNTNLQDVPDDAAAQQARLESELKEIKEAIASKDQELSSQRELEAVSSSAVANAKDSIFQLSAKADAQRGKVAQIEASIIALGEEKARLLERIKEIDTSIAHSQKDIEAIKASNDSKAFEREKSLLEDQKTKAENALAEAKFEGERLSAERSALEGKQNGVYESIQKLSKLVGVSSLIKRIQEMEREASVIKDEISTLVAERDSAVKKAISGSLPPVIDAEIDEDGDIKFSYLDRNNGWVPFGTQTVSDGNLLFASTMLAMEIILSGKNRVLPVSNASLMDSEQLKRLYEYAKAKGIQLIVEDTTRSGANEVAATQLNIYLDIDEVEQDVSAASEVETASASTSMDALDFDLDFD